MLGSNSREEHSELQCTSWWRHQMETFSALLTICAGNSPVTGEFPTQRPVTRSFDVFFDPRLNKRLSKQWRGWWFETPSRSLWRHYNAFRRQWLCSLWISMELTVSNLHSNTQWIANIAHSFYFIFPKFCRSNINFGWEHFNDKNVYHCKTWWSFETTWYVFESMTAVQCRPVISQVISKYICQSL